MLEGGKISNRQAIFLIVSAIIPTSILLLPHSIYKEAKQDSWLSVLVVTAYALIAGLIISRLGKRFPGKTIIEYSQSLLGTFGGWIIGVLHTGLFIHISAIVVREFSELLVANFYNETPQVIFVIGIILTTIFMVRHGLEVLSRVNDTVLPLILLMLVILFLFILPVMMPENILPPLENGIIPVVKGAVPAMVFFSETFIILMITPFLTHPHEVRSVITKAVLTVGMVQLLVVIAVTFVVGAQTTNVLFPTLNMARQIRLYPHLYNVDPLIVLIWVLGGTIKVAVFHYCATLATSQLLKLNNYGIVSIAIGITIGVLSAFLWEDAVELSYHINTIIPPFFVTIQVGIPLFLLIIAAIKQKRGPEDAK